MHNYVIIDTETTGLCLKTDRIVELALIKLEKNKKIKIFHSFFNVKKKITKNAYKINKIKNSFLKKKKPFFKKIKTIDKFIKKSYLVSHNSKFDIGFLKKEYTLLGIKRKFLSIDTLKIFRKLYPGKKNTLKKVCERLKIKIKKKMHRALNDAKILLEVFVKLLNNQVKIS
ncbi:3'-5' exonuclease [Candidatus Vidania fulgoroideorum]